MTSPAKIPESQIIAPIKCPFIFVDPGVICSNHIVSETFALT